MKLKIVFIIVVLLAFTSSAIAGEVKFSDFGNQQQEWPYAEYLIEKNVIKGFPDNTFRPQEPITRAQIVVMVAMLKGIDPLVVQASSFTDVSQDHYAFTIIEALAKEEIISGYPDGAFKPDQSITRAELTTLLFKNYDLDSEEASEINLIDLPKTHWAYKEVSAAAAIDMLDHAEGRVEPDKQATRGMAVVALTRGDIIYSQNKTIALDESIKDKARIVTYATLNSFSSPSFAVRGEGNSIVFTDARNHNLQAIGGYKIVSTLAGKINNKDQYGMPIGGYSDSSVVEAMFNEPKGIVMDNEGNFYVADSANGAIRIIDTDGNVKTLVKNLSSPTGIALGAEGEIYVTESLNHRILKFDSQEKWTVIAGGGYKTKTDEPVGAFADGKGEAAQFNEPQGITIDDDGYLYVADTGNQRIRRVSPEGVVTTIAGSGMDLITGTQYIQGGYLDGDGKKAKFNFPIGIAVGTDKTVYVADSINNCIRVISPTGRVSTLAGSVNPGREDGIASEAKFNTPTDVLLMKDGSLIIIDQENALIRQYIPATNKLVN